jgi:membrane-bound lytic murein transglycosylase D
LGFIIVSLGLSACASLTGHNLEDGYRDPASEPASISGATLESPAEIEKILSETNPVLSEAGGESEKIPLHIPIEINRNVAQWMKFFAERERERTQRYFERGEALRPHIEQILRDNEVPAELYYLAMIESGFVSHAKSRAKAVGVWQFMPGTARNYGLQVNSAVDERRNWIKATEAAASYLKDLNNVFGSWYLALAAYNAGEHRIVRSIMKGKTRDFWALAEAGLLPKETLNYVPKFLAAHIVGKNMKRFNFDVKLEEADKWAPFETVSVPSGTRLRDLSKITGVDHEIIKRWNQDLIRGVTPTTKTGTVDIYIPKENLAAFEQKKEEIAKLKRFKSGGNERVYASAGKSSDGKSYDIYVVRRGDNLSVISRRIGTTVRTLMKINGIRRGRIHPGQRLKFYPVTTSASRHSKKSSGRKVASKKRGKRNVEAKR